MDIATLDALDAQLTTAENSTMKLMVMDETGVRQYVPMALAETRELVAALREAMTFRANIEEALGAPVSVDGKSVFVDGIGDLTIDEYIRA